MPVKVQAEGSFVAKYVNTPGKRPWKALKEHCNMCVCKYVLDAVHIRLLPRT